MAGYSTPHYRPSVSAPYTARGGQYRTPLSAAAVGTTARSGTHPSLQKSLEDELTAARREQQVLQIQLRVAHEENERTISRLREEYHQQLLYAQHGSAGSSESKQLIRSNHQQDLEIERLQHMCETLEDQLVQLRAEHGAMEESQVLTKRQLNEERARSQAGQKELQAANLEIQRLMGKLSSLESAMQGSSRSSAAKVKELEQSLAVSQNECRELASSYKHLQAQHQQSLVDYRTVKTEMDRLSRESRQQYDEYQHEKHRLQAKISQLTHEAHTLDSRSKTQLEATINDLRNANRRMERDNTEQVASNRALQSENSQLHDLLKQAQTELQHTREAFTAEKQSFEKEVHRHLDLIEHSRQRLADKLAEKDGIIAAMQESKNNSMRHQNTVVEAVLNSFGCLQAQVHNIAGVGNALSGQIHQIGVEHEHMKAGIDDTSATMWRDMLAWKAEAEGNYRALFDELSKLNGIGVEMEKHQSEYISLTAEHRSTKQKVVALETAIKQLSASLQDAEERYQEAQEDHQSSLRRADQALAETRQQLHESKQQNKVVQSDLEKAIAQATELQQRIMDTQNELTSHQASQGAKDVNHQQQVAKLIAEATELQRQLFNVTSARDKLQQQLLNSEKTRAQEKQKFEARFQKSHENGENMAAAMKHAKDGTKALTSTLEKYHKQLAQTQALVQSLTRQKAELEKENRLLKAEQLQLPPSPAPSTSINERYLECATPASHPSTSNRAAGSTMTTMNGNEHHQSVPKSRQLANINDTPMPTTLRGVLAAPNLTPSILQSLDFADPDKEDEAAEAASLHYSGRSSNPKEKQLSQWMQQTQFESSEPLVTLDVLAS